MNKPSLPNKRNLTNANALKRPERVLKKQLEYIQDQTNKIRNSVEYRQSQHGKQKMKGVERKAPQEQKLKLPAKKKDYRIGKIISRICSEPLLKSRINLPKNY